MVPCDAPLHLLSLLLCFSPSVGWRISSTRRAPLPPKESPPVSSPYPFFLLFLALITTFLAFLLSRLLSRLLFRRSPPLPPAALPPSALPIFYASQKGHCLRFAQRMVRYAQARGVQAVAIDVASSHPERLEQLPYAVFIVATYSGGTGVPGSEGFLGELSEMSRDFRVEKSTLGGLRFAVFGAGNSEYPPQHFNASARRLDRALRLLGGERWGVRQG